MAAKKKAKSGSGTLLLSVLMSAPGPLVVGLGLLAGRSSTQIADFVRRSAELLAIIVSFVVFRVTNGEKSFTEEAKKMDFIADTKPNQEDVFAYSETLKYRKKLFLQALVVLNKREKDILYKRRLSEKAITLDDLSKFYGISKERVRQIELNSIKKIKKAVETII